MHILRNAWTDEIWAMAQKQREAIKEMKGNNSDFGDTDTIVIYTWRSMTYRDVNNAE